KMGQMVGVWTEYHPNEKPKATGQYLNNLKEGFWTEYDENGKKTGKVKYIRGAGPGDVPASPKADPLPPKN
ncbi:MAG: toxin-antitoxin system YwqK family antitoxin, partial [Bacteroidia bacterium]